MGEGIELTEEHRQKVRQALERIEQAQRLVLSAAEDLSVVDGFATSGRSPVSCTIRSRPTGTWWSDAGRSSWETLKGSRREVSAKAR